MEENPLIHPIIELVEKFKLPLILGLSGLALVLFGLVYTSSQGSKEGGKLVSSTQTSVSASSGSSGAIKVDVSGQVARPGVYDLEANARVENAINDAGGFASGADQDWISKNLNLARVLTDGEKIYIPKAGESLAATTSEGKLINVNRASSSELDTLPGIGKVTAEKIINARPFKKIEELRTRKVVTNSTYEKIKGLISVN